MMTWTRGSYSFCAGDKLSLQEGVFLYCSSAQQNLSWLSDHPFHDIATDYFVMDFIVASTFTLKLCVRIPTVF